MPTRANVRSDALNLLGTDPNISTAELNTIIQARYDSVYTSWPWPRRLRDFTISTVARTTSATATLVTATLSSSTVTAVGGTPFTGTSSRQIQIGSEPNYFFINSVTSATEIVLGDGEGTAVNWPRATASSLSWSIFQTIYALPSDADSVVSLSNGNYQMRELDGGRHRLDYADPDRSTTGSNPLFWWYAGENSSGVREIEVWPVPTSAILLRGQYLRQAPTLAEATELGLPRAMMMYAVASDGASMLFAKTGDAAWQNRSDMFAARYIAEEERFRAIELERTSPPTTIRRRQSGFGRLRGTDFEASHDLDALDVETL